MVWSLFPGSQYCTVHAYSSLHQSSVVLDLYVFTLCVCVYVCVYTHMYVCKHIVCYSARMEVRGYFLDFVSGIKLLSGFRQAPLHFEPTQQPRLACCEIILRT